MDLHNMILAYLQSENNTLEESELNEADIEPAKTFCGLSQDSAPTVSMEFKFIIVGLCTTIVCLVGFLSNICSAVVLSRPKMKSSLNCLLLGLTGCDTVLISTTFLIFSLPTLCDYFEGGLIYTAYIPYISPYFYAIGMTAQTGSVYFTVAVTVERFIAVCHPLHARSLCTWTRAKMYAIFLLLLSALYNVPRWLEFQISYIERGNETLPELEETELRCNEVYIQFYVQWANFIVMSLLPILILIFLNAIIFSEIHRSNSRRQDLSKYQSREISLAVMLLMVVAVFLLCNILPFVNNFMESMKIPMSQELIDISNLLVAVNSSFNCFIYCVFGTKFRKQFSKVLQEFCPSFFNSFCCRNEENSPVHDTPLSMATTGRTNNTTFRHEYSKSMKNFNINVLPKHLLSSQTALV